MPESDAVSCRPAPSDSGIFIPEFRSSPWAMILSKRARLKRESQTRWVSSPERQTADRDNRGKPIHKEMSVIVESTTLGEYFVRGGMEAGKLLPYSEAHAIAAPGASAPATKREGVLAPEMYVNASRCAVPGSETSISRGSQRRRDVQTASHRLATGCRETPSRGK